ncbi:MAG: GTP-binding protein [Pseudomonadota bacterium]
MKRFSIITGFLGSGKTTLLNRLLRHPAMTATAVIINELGEVGIDHLIVDEFDDDIVLLESGCVCCTVRDDLTTSLLGLYERSRRGEIPPFESAVLETTGIADPGAILQLLMADTDICRRYRFATVATVVDACHASDNLAQIPEARRQVLLADRLLLSKLDQVDDGRRDRLRETLQRLNPQAPCFVASRVTPDQLFPQTAMRPPVMAAESVTHGGRFGAFHVGWTAPVDLDAVVTWAEGLLSARGDDLFRIKAVLNVTGDDRPVLLQTVQHSAYPPQHLSAWPAAAPRSDVVMIAQNFSARAARASLEPFVPLGGDGT